MELCPRSDCFSYGLSVFPDKGRCLWLLRTKPASVCYALLSYMSPQTLQLSWQSDRLCSRGCSSWCEAIQKPQLHLLLAVTYESVLHRSVVFWEQLLLCLRKRPEKKEIYHLFHRCLIRQGQTGDTRWHMMQNHVLFCFLLGIHGIYCHFYIERVYYTCTW